MAASPEPHSPVSVPPLAGLWSARMRYAGEMEIILAGLILIGVVVTLFVVWLRRLWRRTWKKLDPLLGVVMPREQ